MITPSEELQLNALKFKQFNSQTLKTNECLLTKALKIWRKNNICLNVKKKCGLTHIIIINCFLSLEHNAVFFNVSKWTWVQENEKSCKCFRNQYMIYIVLFYSESNTCLQFLYYVTCINVSRKTILKLYYSNKSFTFLCIQPNLCWRPKGLC